MAINSYMPWRKRKKAIKLFWFRHKYPTTMNFGDELSYELVKKISGKEVVWASVEKCEMVAVGSILETVLQRKSKNNVTVWGSGLMFDGGQVNYEKTQNDIRAVRGKLSTKRLGLENIPCGDPGLLADMLYKPSKNIKKIGIVPHYVDKTNLLVEKLSRSKEVKIIDVYDKPSKVASEIGSCKIVVSSSLHGIITAHSFGIPAYWVELSDKVAGEGFKFLDYYSNFGIKPLKLDNLTFRNLINKADELISNYEQPRNIEKIKDDMLRAFPKDI